MGRFRLPFPPLPGAKPCEKAGLNRVPKIPLKDKNRRNLGETWGEMVPPERIELSTSPLPMVRSTTELRRPVKARRTMPSAAKMSTAAMTVSVYKVDMSNPPRKQSASETERLARQAEALRENLRRRKQQTRAREDDGPKTPPASEDGPEDADRG